MHNSNTAHSAPLHFYKLQALGNDYILFDGTAGDPLPDRALYAPLCRRWTAVGADGILLLEKSSSADAALRIINADGSEAEMCANGLRCAAWYLRLVRRMGPQLTLHTAAGLRNAQVLHSRGGCAEVCAAVGQITALGDTALSFYACSTGNPHACFQLQDIRLADEAAARAAAEQSGLFPNGVNIGFWQPAADNTVSLRVFERGVGETAACGTGAAAAAAAAVAAGICCAGAPITVRQAGGALLVTLDSEQNATVTGEARFLFAGSIPFAEAVL